MPKDPYTVLGVARDASVDDIKKAYRALSKEWHPDKHPSTGSGQVRKKAEERFKEINEAYETLNDPQKKERYDRFGSAEGFAGGQGFPGFDFSGFSSGGIGDFADLFEGFFGGQRGRSAARDEGSDVQVEVVVDLKDVLTATERTISLRTLARCDACHGSGAAPGAKIETCSECGGTGQVSRTAQSFFGTIQQRMICPRCKGAGKIPSEACAACRGEGRTMQKREVTVRIPGGIDDGQTLRVRGEGEAGKRGAAAGDLYVTVRVRSDARFAREGADLRSTVAISVIDALLGAEIHIDTVHGEVTLAIPEGTQPDQVFRIKGKGLPVLGTSRHGDHYVTVKVDIPKKLSRTERKIVEEWRGMR